MPTSAVNHSEPETGQVRNHNFLFASSFPCSATTLHCLKFDSRIRDTAVGFVSVQGLGSSGCTVGSRVVYPKVPEKSLLRSGPSNSKPGLVGIPIKKEAMVV